MKIIAPEQLLSNLIRFNTTNPPGNESECIAYIKSLFDDAGIESKILAKDENRANLYARLPGAGSAPPIMLYGHVDVVPVLGQEWSVDPFAGIIKDGCIWGRGALDMKGFLVMFIHAVLRLKAENTVLPFDVILFCLSDEESNGDFGAKYICEAHSGLLSGVKYAFGEIGGFSMCLFGKRFYPIMLSEKQCAHLRITVKGQGGHGSTINRGSAVSKLGRVLVLLAEKRLPLHVTDEARMMIETIASHLGGIKGMLLKQTLNPAWSNKILNLLGEDGEYFDSILHNTVNATIIENNNKSINVIPSEAAVELDTRLVPRQKIEDVVGELRALIGDEYAIDVIMFDPGPESVDSELYETLSQVIKKADSNAIPIPYIMSGVTDGRFFAMLGIQTYGFTPLFLPDDFPLIKLIHGADERVPVDALRFGCDAVFEALQTQILFKRSFK